MLFFLVFINLLIKKSQLMSSVVCVTNKVVKILSRVGTYDLKRMTGHKKVKLLIIPIKLLILRSCPSIHRSIPLSFCPRSNQKLLSFFSFSPFLVFLA